MNEQNEQKSSSSVLETITSQTSITIALTVALCGGAFVGGTTYSEIKTRVNHVENGLAKQQETLDRLTNMAGDLKRRTDLLEFQVEANAKSQAERTGAFVESVRKNTDAMERFIERVESKP